MIMLRNMLRKMSSLKGFKVQGLGDELGKLTDFYFDQHHFILRYLVIDTGNWLNSNKMLVSTTALEDIDYQSREILINLSAEELEDGPELNCNKPISKLMEEKLTNHFNWPVYWLNPYPSGGPTVQSGTQMREKLLNFRKLTDQEKQNQEKEIESNLRSFNEIKGYHIQAEDKEFGHLKDLFFDEENWIIRYLLIDTRNILPGKDVLIAPEWLQNISWNNQKLYLNKPKTEIKNAPEYIEGKSDHLVNPSYEEKLYNHYEEIKYWQQ